MLMRIAIVVLALATPVAAQEEERTRVSELEAGAGWYQWNPFGVSDFIVFPSAPSATISRMVWRTVRHGYATGISAVLGKVDPREGNQVRERAFPIYAHVSYRWRWFLKDPENSIHFGVGIGPGVFRRTDLVRAWGTERGTWHYPGETKTRWRLAVHYHTELFFTTRLQENVDLRTGIRWLPLLYLPLAAEPMVMGVWRFWRGCSRATAWSCPICRPGISSTGCVSNKPPARRARVVQGEDRSGARASRVNGGMSR